MSTFNPDQFLNTETSESTSTTYTPIPENEYTACVKEIKPRSTTSGKAILDVVWSIDDQDGSIEAATGLKQSTVRQSIFLDITESGGLDIGKGKNVQLGKVREALSQNTPGKVWRPGDLIGGVAKVQVKHRMDGDATYVDVKAVTKI